jgi:hypothetical protein
MKYGRKVKPLPLVPVLSPNYKQHILSPAKVRKARYSLAELHDNSVYLNLFGWRGAWCTWYIEKDGESYNNNNNNNNNNNLYKKTAILGTSHIIRKVLQAAIWSLSGGVHHWLKSRSAREERKPVTRNGNNNNNNNNIMMNSSLFR